MDGCEELAQSSAAAPCIGRTPIACWILWDSCVASKLLPLIQSYVFLLLLSTDDRWFSEFNVAVDKAVSFLQEQGQNVVLSDVDRTFHAIKVKAVQYAMQFFPSLFLAIYNLFSDSNCSCFVYIFVCPLCFWQYTILFSGSNYSFFIYMLDCAT